MHPTATEAIEREGWRLMVADAGLTPELREAMIARSLEAVHGALGAPKRRSRHASTWQIRIGSRADLEIFIKVLDAPRGFAVVKRILRASRVAHVARITQRLNDSAFFAPPLLLLHTLLPALLALLVLHDRPTNRGSAGGGASAHRHGARADAPGPGCRRLPAAPQQGAKRGERLPRRGRCR